MTTLRLATAQDRETLSAMVAQFHHETGDEISDQTRKAALEMLFTGTVQAGAWLLGPRRAPVGYIVVSFGFSMKLGGRDACIDEFYIRKNLRGRGMGSQALLALSRELSDAGVRAVHLEVDPENPNAQRLYGRAGFTSRDRRALMIRHL